MNQDEVVIPPPFPSQQTPPPLSQKENLYAAFVGEKYQSFYREKFEGLEAPKPKGGFNIAAFFLGAIWLFYRKMYAYGFAYIGFVIVSGIVTAMLNVSESVDRAISIGFAVTMGLCGNGLYKHFIDKKIKENNLSAEQAQAMGGTNPIAAWSLFIFIILLIGTAIFLDG